MTSAMEAIGGRTVGDVFRGTVLSAEYSQWIAHNVKPKSPDVNKQFDQQFSFLWANSCAPVQL
jgi:hypothetical protein